MKANILFFILIFFYCNRGYSQQCYLDTQVYSYPIYQNGVYYGSLPTEYEYTLTGNTDSTVYRIIIRLYKGADNVGKKVYLSSTQKDSLRQLLLYGSPLFSHRKNTTLLKGMLLGKRLNNLVSISDQVFSHVNGVNDEISEKYNRLTGYIEKSNIQSLTIYDNNLVYIPDLFSNSTLSALDISFSKNIHYLPLYVNFSRGGCVIINKYNNICLIQGIVASAINSGISFTSDTFDYELSRKLFYLPILENHNYPKNYNLVLLNSIRDIPKTSIKKVNNTVYVYADTDSVKNIKIGELNFNGEGKLDGACKLYYLSAGILQFREYKNGQPVGNWFTYDEFGNELSQVRFKYNLFRKQKIKIHTSIY